MSSLNKDLPYPYASFVVMLVKFHMLVHSFDTGIQMCTYTERGPQASCSPPFRILVRCRMILLMTQCSARQLTPPSHVTAHAAKGFMGASAFEQSCL